MTEYFAHYILNQQGEPEPSDDLSRIAWCFTYDERRVVRRQTFVIDDREVTVSTVFLVVNHGFDDGPPVLWETMVFDSSDNGIVRRYRSREEAIRGHNLIVRELGGPVLEGEIAGEDKNEQDDEQQAEWRPAVVTPTPASAEEAADEGEDQQDDQNS